jgi:hypothetical protein
VYPKQAEEEEEEEDDNDINLRLGGASKTNIPRPPKGYWDVLSWGIIYK